VTGDLDTVVPAVNSFLLAALLPAARLRVVRGGGHMCILEQATELGPMLRDFLQQVRPRTGSHRVG
jgi:pimeloyl-ACP methyl ester carboxylesterase